MLHESYESKRFIQFNILLPTFDAYKSGLPEYYQANYRPRSNYHDEDITYKDRWTRSGEIVEPDLETTITQAFV